MPASSDSARTAVAPEDLEHLDVLHRILATLSEPAASAPALAQLIEKMPVLANRLQVVYSLGRHERYGRAATARVLGTIGNRAFERVLLELLEDLTILRGELGG